MTYGVRQFADGHLWELCDECGFDGRAVLDEAAALADALRALRSLISERDDAGEQPASGTWSATEYGEHAVEVTCLILDKIRDACHLPDAVPAGDLDEAASQARAFVAALAPDQRALPVRINEHDVTVSVVVSHLLHDLEHHVLDVRRGLAKLALRRGREVLTITR